MRNNIKVIFMDFHYHSSSILFLERFFLIQLFVEKFIFHWLIAFSFDWFSILPHLKSFENLEYFGRLYWCCLENYQVSLSDFLLENAMLKVIFLLIKIKKIRKITLINFFNNPVIYEFFINNYKKSTFFLFFYNLVCQF